MGKLSNTRKVCNPTVSNIVILINSRVFSYLHSVGKLSKS